MAKYRLCYKSYYDGYQEIDLEGFKFLIGEKVTNLESIDTLTCMFNNEKELLDFFKERKLIDKSVTKLYITKDKKSEEKIKNEKIYNGENLLFKMDSNITNISFIEKWFKENENNHEIMLDIIRYYKNEYKTNFDNSSTFKKLCDLEILLLNKINGFELDKTESYEVYFQNIEYFIKHEFYQLNNDFSIKKDEYGNKKIKYRNIRDFAILVKLIDINLVYPSVDGYKSESPKEIEEADEFITSEDYKKMKEELIKNFYSSDVSKEDYEDSLDEYASKYTLR